MPHSRHPSPFDPTPPLYPFRDRELRNRFLQLVRERLGRGGRSVVIEHGMARVEGEFCVHGLSNLAGTCHMAPPAMWPQLVDEHFAKSEPDRLLGAVADIADSDYAAQADRLVVRIHDQGFARAEWADHVLHRVDLPTTCSVLTFDMGPSVMPVPKPIAEAWGVPAPELFARAMRNLPRLSQARWSRLSLPHLGDAVDVLGEDFHATAHILDAATFRDRTGRLGNLVGIPAREVLISYRLEAAPTALLLQALLAITNGKFNDGPGPVTPHLFWRDLDGRFHVQYGSSDGARAKFVPSAEFLAAMAAGGTPLA
ncbi:MAG: hypothetical protein MUC36_15130 [Planctomycetes bacterium]|nr:hypothetical protein [Planctomycetota bacterium]